MPGCEELQMAHETSNDIAEILDALHIGTDTSVDDILAVFRPLVEDAQRDRRASDKLWDMYGEDAIFHPLSEAYS